MTDEELEIDSKLRALEQELEEMKRRTNNILSLEQLAAQRGNVQHMPTSFNHADLVNQLVNRTPVPDSIGRQANYLPKVPVLDIGLGTQAALRNADLFTNRNQSNDIPLARLELEQAERRVAELSQQSNIERSFSNAERTKRERLEVDCMELKRRLGDQEKELVIFKATNEREVIEIRSQLRQSSINIQSLEDALSSSKSDLGRENMIRRQLETQLAVFQTQKNELEKRSSFLEQTIRDLHASVDDLTHRLSSIGEEKDAVERRLRQQVSKVESVAESDRMRQEAETSALKLRSQLVELQRQRKDDAQEIQKLIGDNDVARHEISKLSEECFNTSSELEKTRNQLLNVTGENKQLKVVTDKHRVELRRLADQISLLQHDNRALVKAQHDSLIAAVSADLTQLSPRFNVSSPIQQYHPVGSPLLSSSFSPRINNSFPEHPKSRHPEPQRPPWAMESPGLRELRSEGVAAAMTGLSSEETDMERELLELNQERQTIESWLSKIPLNSGGRTMTERKEKQAKEYRLSCVDARIGQIKSSLRRRKLI